MTGVQSKNGKSKTLNPPFVLGKRRSFDQIGLNQKNSMHKTFICCVPLKQ
jgi:hypothetical protein